MTDEQCTRICERILLAAAMLSLCLCVGLGLGMMGISFQVHALADKIVCH